MATEDGLNADDFLLLFLSDKPLSVTDEPEQQGTWLAGLLAWSGHWLSAGWLHAKLVLAPVLSGVHGFFARWVKDFGNDRAVAVASILVTTATATGIAILSTVNPVTLFAGFTASLADKSAPQLSTVQSTPIIQSVVVQSTADAEALPPTTQDVPTREINTPEPASQTKKENDEASSEALFMEFRAWNAEQGARDLAKPLQIHPEQVAKNASASVRPKQKQQAQTIRNAKQTQSRSFLSELLPF